MREKTTREDARFSVEVKINQSYDDPDDCLVVLDTETVEKPYGWVFFVESKTFVDTGNESFQLAGNGPIVVLASDGSIHQLGSAMPPEEEVLEFERSAGLKA